MKVEYGLIKKKYKMMNFRINNRVMGSKFMDFEKMKWNLQPQKGKRLVRETDECYHFAHFAQGNIETQFYGYMQGYKETADTLITHAVNSKNIRILDTFVFPICFLYRQYVELAMKNIFLQYSGVDKEAKIKVIKKVSHNLIEIWKIIKPILIQETTEEEKKDIEVVEDYIKQFNEFDKSSFIFCYLTNKELDLSFNEAQYLDLINLRERMNEVYNFFEGYDVKLNTLRDFKYEMMSYYLSDLDY